MNRIAFAVAALIALPAHAVTLNFDDLDSSSSIGMYDGFDFSNFYALDARTFIPSGYANGVISRENVAYNGGGLAATISAGSAFSLTSGYLAAAWNDGLTVDLVGTLNNAVAFTQSFVIDTASATFETFNHALVDKVVFTTSGGTPHPGYILGFGTQLSLDNLTIRTPAVNAAASSAPEPASWAMLITGLGLVGWAMRQRRRATA